MTNNTILNCAIYWKNRLSDHPFGLEVIVYVENLPEDYMIIFLFWRKSPSKKVLFRYTLWIPKSPLDVAIQQINHIMDQRYFQLVDCCALEDHQFIPRENESLEMER